MVSQALESFFTARSPDDVLRLARGVGEMMRVRCGLVHPALAEAIGAVIGITGEEVLAIARYEATLVDRQVFRPAVIPVDDDALFDVIDHAAAGIPALRRHLGERADLLIEAVPMTEVGPHPTVRSADPAVRVERTHPITDAYDTFARNVERLERLDELSAPEVLVASQNRAVQLAFERLVGHMRNDVVATPKAAAKAPLQLAPPPTKWTGAGARALLFLDDKRLLVQTPESTKILRVRGGALVRAVAVALPARYCLRDRVVFADAVAYAFVTGGLHGVALLDAATGKFDTALTEERPARVITEGVMDEGAAVVWDPHAQSGTGVELATFGPVIASYTRDGALGWVLGAGYEGAIVELATASLFVRTEDFPFEQQELKLLDLKGKVSQGAPFAREEESRVTAIAVTEERRYRLLGPNGVVVENDRPLFALGFRPEAAAWSPDARKLALLHRGAVVVVDAADEPRIVARYQV